MGRKAKPWERKAVTMILTITMMVSLASCKQEPKTPIIGDPKGTIEVETIETEHIEVENIIYETILEENVIS